MNLGKDVTITALGKKWTLSRLTLNLILKIRDYVAEVVGDPYEGLESKLAFLSGDDSKMVLIREADAVAKQLRNFSLASPIAQEVMETEIGGAEIFYLMLKENHPELTVGEVFDIIMEAGDQLPTALDKASGKVGGGNFTPERSHHPVLASSGKPSSGG